MQENRETDKPEPSFNVDNLAKNLARFYGKNVHIARQKILEYLQKNSTASKEQVFTDLSSNLGSSSTHASGKPEGKKPSGRKGSKFRGLRRGGNRRSRGR
jgi:hypothetical protein